MELWIRSQDKEVLLNIKGIQYQNYKLVENETVEANILIGLYNYYDNEILGEYETKERALEVLDEIQRIIYPKEYIEFNLKIMNKSKTELIKDHYSSYLSSYVYEMPEK